MEKGIERATVTWMWDSKAWRCIGEKISRDALLLSLMPAITYSKVSLSGSTYASSRPTLNLMVTGEAKCIP